MHRVNLRVLEFCQRVICCYVKCGIQAEGREREGARIEGKYETDLIMSILDREYQTLKKERQMIRKSFMLSDKDKDNGNTGCRFTTAIKRIARKSLAKRGVWTQSDGK